MIVMMILMVLVMVMIMKMVHEDVIMMLMMPSSSGRHGPCSSARVLGDGEPRLF